MNAQEIFNKAYLSIIKQGHKSVQPEGPLGSLVCVYNGPNNSHCAAAMLVPEEFLPEMIEQKQWKLQPIKILEAVRGNNAFLDELITDIQMTHDNCPEKDFVFEFKSRMRSLANQYKLEVPDHDC